MLAAYKPRLSVQPEGSTKNAPFAGRGILDNCMGPCENAMSSRFIPTILFPAQKLLPVSCRREIPKFLPIFVRVWVECVRLVPSIQGLPAARREGAFAFLVEKKGSWHGVYRG